MRESTYFIFDNRNSKDYGIFLGSTETGLYKESFLPSRALVEKKIAGREKPYFQRVEQEPLSFPLSFVLEDWGRLQDVDYLRRVARWLFQPYYKPLVLDSNPNRVFYAIVEGESTLFHNGAKDGYVELKIRCDSPYGYSHEYNQENIQFRDDSNSVEVSNDISDFDNGTHVNTIATSNGLTIENTVDSWGALYSVHQKWGEIV